MEGWRDFCAVKARLRDALRPAGDGDLWVGPAPSIEEIDERLGGDHEARRMLFEWSMVECVENYFQDERLQMAYLGQGVIGTNASPHDPGTASIHFHHPSGRLGGRAGDVGIRQGGDGHGLVPPLRHRPRPGAVMVATGRRSPGSCPARGSSSKGASGSRAGVVVSNADPRATLRLLGEQADPAWKARVEAIPQVGCTVKLNVVAQGAAQLHGAARDVIERITWGRSTRR